MRLKLLGGEPDSGCRQTLSFVSVSMTSSLSVLIRLADLGVGEQPSDPWPQGKNRQLSRSDADRSRVACRGKKAKRIPHAWHCQEVSKTHRLP